MEPAPRKSVTKPKRLPFQANRTGQEPVRRFVSSMEVNCLVVRLNSACQVLSGQRTRSTSACGCPDVVSLGHDPCAKAIGIATEFVTAAIGSSVPGEFQLQTVIAVAFVDVKLQARRFRPNQQIGEAV